MKKFKKWQIGLLGIIGLALAGTVTAIIINQDILSRTKPHIFAELENIPNSQAALILGARVYTNGNMSDILADRSIKALELYQDKKVEKILVSGDHGTVDYDEVKVVRDFLLQNDIPEEDIFLDHAGFDTYDSLYRAKHIFQVETLIVVTQEFHLPRAVYIGQSLGIETYGYIADRQTYLAARWNNLRESLARIKAFLDVSTNAQPKFLGEAIPITGDGRATWDDQASNL